MAGARQVEVVGTHGTEGRQLNAELVEAEDSDFFVEVLEQHVDLGLVLAVVGEELDLRQHLVGEPRAHHKAPVIIERQGVTTQRG